MWCMSSMLLWWSCQSPVAHSCGLLNHPNSFHRGMFNLNTKFDADSLLYLLSHFECNSHRVHMLTQWCLPPPPPTSTVKSSLFRHTHSSLHSLAARLHWCHANCSRYINNGWTFSRQTSYITNFFNYFLCDTIDKFLITLAALFPALLSEAGNIRQGGLN